MYHGKQSQRLWLQKLQFILIVEQMTNQVETVNWVLISQFLRRKSIWSNSDHISQLITLIHVHRRSLHWRAGCPVAEVSPLMMQLQLDRLGSIIIRTCHSYNQVPQVWFLSRWYLRKLICGICPFLLPRQVPHCLLPNYASVLQIS